MPVRWTTLSSVLLVLMFFLVQGCAQAQYEKPAKEWCLAMRANQVVPVYPLTQDIRPGDVFLVQRTIGDQTEEYKQRGFLSLDDSRKRLPLPQDAFTLQYFTGYFNGEFTPQDYPVRTPANTSAQTGRVGTVSTALTATPAPRAAFPTYTFSVKRGEGLSLGVPISGIPVALNFMNAGEATGVVVLADASTYQADHDILMQELEQWTRKPEVATELKSACEYMKQEYVYLRVVKRVYMVGAVDVKLENKERTQAGGQFGLAQQSTDPNISVATFEQNLEKQSALIGVLNSLANASKIGGAVSFNLATERSVGLSESFDRPLVVGYLGMDVPYFRTGDLGAPIPTFEVLEGMEIRSPVKFERDELLTLTRVLRASSQDPARATQALNAIMAFGQTISIPTLKAFGPRAQAIAQLPDGDAKRAQTAIIIKELVTGINAQAILSADAHVQAREIIDALHTAMRGQGLI